MNVSLGCGGYCLTIQQVSDNLSHSHTPDNLLFYTFLCKNKSASDGIRFTADNAPFATYNSRYFGRKRGITVVTHVADVWMPFSLPVITNTSSEALYIIDALGHHESDLNIKEHYTDSASTAWHKSIAGIMLW